MSWPGPSGGGVNGSGQRLPVSLHPTQAALVNPLHPNCYAAQLVEQLKAENPGILSEDVYNFDYSANFAPKSLRVPLGSCLKDKIPEIPQGIKAISERQGTKEVYQLKGYEDNPNAVGFLFEGGPRPGHYGKAAYEAHQQIGAAMGSTGKFHAVTFSLLYAYLVQGRSNISRQAQRLGAVAIDHGVKHGIEARSEDTSVMDIAPAGAHDPRINQLVQAVQNMQSQFVELKQDVGQLEGHQRRHDLSYPSRDYKIKSKHRPTCS